MRLSMTSKVALAALAWSLSTVAGWPQQTDQQPANQPSGPAPAAPEQPAAPVPSPLGTSGVPAPQGESTGTPAETPAPVDTRPLAGAEAIGPTLPGGGRSYVLPSFSIFQGVDTNAEITPGTSNLQAAAIPTASLDLNHAGRRNLFSLNYGGGVIIYETDSSLTSTFQALGFSDKYTAARWNLLIGDHFSYLPQASLGFGGIGYGGTFGPESLGLGSGIGLNAAYTPGQSILTGQSGTTTNTAVAQAQYNFTPRSSFTAVGAFGIVHYTQGGLSSGNDTILTLAYDHQVTSYDTLSVSYSFAALRFNGGSEKINDNLVRLGYGHRLTNRFTFTVLGGPEYTQTAITGISGVQSRLSWTGQATLGYKVERGSLNASYFHYVSLGSGVFNGAVTDNVSGNFNREISRTWNAGVGFGYSRNAPLGAYSINPNFANPGTFDYEYGSFRLDHNFGHFTRGFFTYNLQRQQSGAAYIPGANGRVIIRHIFGIGLELHPRPWPI
jgi:hypothetical protein